jgi:7 transmembrane sweet-taste receptor of 3 GCPR
MYATNVVNKWIICLWYVSFLNSLVVVQTKVMKTGSLHPFAANSFVFLMKLKALSPLFAKVWRMHKLLTTPNPKDRAQLNNFQAFLYTLPAIAIELLILTVFSLADPPRQTELLGVGEGIGEQQISCTHQSNAFMITQIVYDGILVGIGCILAYQTKDLDPRFGEAKQLGMFLSMFMCTYPNDSKLTNICHIIFLAYRFQYVQCRLHRDCYFGYCQSR